MTKETKAGEEVKRPRGNPNLKKGVILNPAGRTPDDELSEEQKKKRKLSKLRRVENRLLRLNNKALETIENLLEKDPKGQDLSALEKEQVAISRWVVSQTTTVTRAATAEEVLLNNMKDSKLREEIEQEQEADEEGQPTAVFSLQMLEQAEETVAH